MKNLQSLSDLGDAVSKLDTFVWVLNHILVSVDHKSIILGQTTNLNMILHVMVSLYRLVKIQNLLQFPAEFWNSLWLTGK